MNPLPLAFAILGTILTLYLAACLVKILHTWFGPTQETALGRFLDRLCNPWLKPFSRLRFLHFRNLDFSPVIALVVLQLVVQLCFFLSMPGALTFAIVLSTFLTLLGSAITMIVFFFAALAALRLIGIFMKRSSIQQFWFTLDHILQPMVYPLLAKLFPRRVIPYGTGLGIFLALTILLSLGVHFGMEFLSDLALAIPF